MRRLKFKFTDTTNEALVWLAVSLIIVSIALNESEVVSQTTALYIFLGGAVVAGIAVVIGLKRTPDRGR